MVLLARIGRVFSVALIALAMSASALAQSVGVPPPTAAAQPVEAVAQSIGFTRDVIPVLTKAGCNAGACHGSFQGRGGLRLSLLGFDPAADYNALVREAHGRRVFPAAPEQSLILRKAVMTVPHGGNKRFAADSTSYRILREWMARGMPGPQAADPHVARLEVTSLERPLQLGEQMQLQVRVVWSDGSAQDATPWVLYESNSDRVAQVSSAGLITVRGAGRAAVTVRHLGQVAAVPVTVPYAALADFPALPRQNFIDDLAIEEWKKLGLLPAGLATDSEFARRVHLDLSGTLPQVDELRSFLDSSDPDKRSKLIDKLLDRPEFVDFWALKWADLLRAHRRSLGDKGLRSFTSWLRQALRDNWPADKIVRALVTAKGNLYNEGPVAFYFVDRTPEDLAETTAQVFLGLRMQCAKCHHHPFDVFSQDDYYGLAAFFARVQRKDTKESGAFGGAQSIRIGATGTVTHPGTGQVITPRTLGSVAEVPDANDPRVTLANWITSRDNPYFARNIVNRYWGYLFGRGLVDPIDDLRPTNPPSHPALLDALTRDFVQHNFDLKHLLRTMCNSRTYQLASEVAPERDADGMFFTHRRPRRLPAEILLDAINQTAGVDEAFENSPKGTRAIALSDPSAASYFLDIFGRPRRTSTCECERRSQPDLIQVLHLSNSEKMHAKLADPAGRVARLLAANQNDTQIIDELYMAALSRLPTAEERTNVARLITAAPSRKEGLEDLLWALINSAEFVFLH
ncbi:MAG: Protein of unknown function (DUF1553)/Protein of unknown function [Planctomycetaceae bacterium]|nr:Protein of unknown function (DUF1553)/Protein of unknown function [Planctomycetaceae bacterium]